ncbi:hypothetical protein V5799_003948, partial [Amblyomma americanum]
MSRGKVLGGSSVLNFLLYTRGSIHDYDRWAREYGATGWAYEDVLPHFKAIEDYRAGQPDDQKYLIDSRGGRPASWTKPSGSPTFTHGGACQHGNVRRDSSFHVKRHRRVRKQQN